MDNRFKAILFIRQQWPLFDYPLGLQRTGEHKLIDFYYTHTANMCKLWPFCEQLVNIRLEHSTNVIIEKLRPGANQLKICWFSWCVYCFFFVLLFKHINSNDSRFQPIEQLEPRTWARQIECSRLARLYGEVSICFSFNSIIQNGFSYFCSKFTNTHCILVIFSVFFLSNIGSFLMEHNNFNQLVCDDPLELQRPTWLQTNACTRAIIKSSKIYYVYQMENIAGLCDDSRNVRIYISLNSPDSANAKWVMTTHKNQKHSLSSIKSYKENG